MRRVSADLGHSPSQTSLAGPAPQTPTFSSILSHDPDGPDGLANETNGHAELEKPFRYSRCVFKSAYFIFKVANTG
jgi:hypothetical protein